MKKERTYTEVHRHCDFCEEDLGVADSQRDSYCEACGKDICDKHKALIAPPTRVTNRPGFTICKDHINVELPSEWSQ